MLRLSLAEFSSLCVFAPQGSSTLLGRISLGIGRDQRGVASSLLETNRQVGSYQRCIVQLDKAEQQTGNLTHRRKPGVHFRDKGNSTSGVGHPRRQAYRVPSKEVRLTPSAKEPSWVPTCSVEVTSFGRNRLNECSDIVD